MKNKNVIRKKLENGKFTTVHNSILLDTRLSPNAFRLFIAILSDSDTQFNLSQTLYCKRLGIAKKTFFKAIANLEECGYLRKSSTKIKNLYHYTISEFGNLNNETESSSKLIEENDFNEETSNTKTSNGQYIVTPEIKEFINSIEKLLKYRGPNDLMFKLLEENAPIEKFKKELNDMLLSHYKYELSNISKKDENPKAYKELKEWLKTEIFEKHILDSNVSSKWAKLRLIKYAKSQPKDYETEMGDYYENPKD